LPLEGFVKLGSPKVRGEVMLASAASPFFHEQRAGRNLRGCDLKVCIVGCGAIGANLAETLARMGLPQMRLIDFDRVEPRNLSTQPFLRSDVGQLKARALARLLYRATQCRAEAIAEKLTSENADKLLAGSDLVVDCLDNSASRLAVQTAVRKLSLPCLHVGFSGDGYGEVIWDERYTVPDDSHIVDPCDYPFTRPLMHLLVGVAAETVVRFLLNGERLNWTVTLSDLKILPLPFC
jgi:molybdopterin/thiamine biosynthesis adenylyltransferase